MQIRFVRSGGFSGAATDLSGAVDFQDTGVQVHSEAAGYQRDLSGEEAEQLRAGADPTNLLKAKAALSKAPPSPLRDAYQYEITVTDSEGRTETLTVHGDVTPSLQQVAPATATLASWVRAETQRIWKHRVSARK